MAARLYTAMVLVVLFFCMAMFLPWVPYTLLISALALFAAWEWGRLSTPSAGLRIGFLALIASVMLALWLYPAVWEPVIAIGGGNWLFFFCMLAYFETCKQIPRWPARVWLCIGILAIVPLWLSFIWLRMPESPHGGEMLLFLLLLTMCMDGGAWFVGKRAVNPHKMTRTLSPGKTWEGLFGGLLIGMAVLLCILLWNPLPQLGRGGLLAFGFLVLVVANVGDLLVSTLKRYAKVKDSGQWLPGHGGLLDRADSLCATAPVYAAGLLFLGGQE
ncbi:MAG: phosphatidate cytidylyltransferase [Candidatus Eutrophobiaceae bacterium]